MKIERLHPDDWREYRDIRLAGLADAPQAFSSTLEGESEFSEADWRERLAGRTQFIARADGRAVGTVGGYLTEDGLAHLVAMWVAPGWRGRGAGDALITAVAGWARQTGYPAMTLWVTIGNQAAQRLYERHGFRATGVIQPVRPGEPDHLEQEMRKALDTAPAGQPAGADSAIAAS